MLDVHTENLTVSGRGRAVRVVISLVVTGLVVATTLWGSDDFFPFTPFRMYAFSADLDSSTGSTRVEAVDEEGERFKLTEDNTGFRRAEVEGQLDRFREDPSLLRFLAQAYENANPEAPEIVSVEVIIRRYDMEDGYKTGEVTETVEVAWTRERVDA